MDEGFLATKATLLLVYDSQGSREEIHLAIVFLKMGRDVYLTYLCIP